MGRPKKTDRQNINLSLTRDLIAQIKIAAFQANRSVSAIVEDLLRAYLSGKGRA